MNPSIIIPAAHTGLRRNAKRPKIDVDFVDNQKLYERQINLLREYYPSGTITYILGFHADKVDNQLKDLGCNIVYNNNYETNSVPYSLKMTGELKETLIIYGDIFFSEEYLEYLPKNPSGSYIIKDIQNNFDKRNVGIGPNGYMSFCFEHKWTQTVYFDNSTAESFNEKIKKTKNHKKFTFELINELYDEKPFHIYTSSGYCKEMDTIADYNEINKWIFNNKNNENSN